MENEKRLTDVNPIIRNLTAMKSMYDAISLDGMIKALEDAPAVDYSAAAPVVGCTAEAPAEAPPAVLKTFIFHRAPPRRPGSTFAAGRPAVKHLIRVRIDKGILPIRVLKPQLPHSIPLFS